MHPRKICNISLNEAISHKQTNARTRLDFAIYPRICKLSFLSTPHCIWAAGINYDAWMWSGDGLFFAVGLICIFNTRAHKPIYRLSKKKTENEKIKNKHYVHKKQRTTTTHVRLINTCRHEAEKKKEREFLLNINQLENYCHFPTRQLVNDEHFLFQNKWATIYLGQKTFLSPTVLY